MYFPDLNVPEARTAVEGHISGLGDAGYEGLFFDLGNRAYVGGTPSNDGDLSNMISGCHPEDVIDPDWTFGHSQWDVVRQAGESGFTTFVNCCIPSDLESSDVAAADLANQDADHLLTEQTKTSVAWDDIIPINDESEQTLGRVVNFHCADGHFTNAYYAWGRAKLWHQPVVVNAGDTDPTGTCDEGRNRSGLFPELTDARLGEPVDASYSTGDCDTSGCTYYRRYAHGLVSVNTGTMGALSSGRVELGIDGCRYMAEATPEGPRPIGMVDGEERCHPATTRNLNPQRAIILLYRESPWLS